MKMDKYKEGIEKGIAMNLILVQGKKKRADYFDHYNEDPTFKSGFKSTNTRKLNTTVDAIAGTFPGRFRYLELGAGAGVSAATVSEIYGAEVHTVGLSPINPFLRFHAHYLQPDDDDSLSCNFEHLIRGMWHFSEETISALGRRELPPQLLFELQEEYGAMFFMESSVPFIHRQFIGRFPEDINFEGNTYDLIVDDCGACLYSLAVEDSTKARLISALLSSRGVFFTRLERFCNLEFPQTISICDPYNVLVLKKGNPLFEVSGGKSVKVDNLAKFVRASVEKTFS